MVEPLTVLLSFPPPQSVYNPYTIMLTEAIRDQPGVTALNFSWRTALFGRYDVFHVHWPENLASGHSPVKKAVRQALMAAFMLRMEWRNIPVVRTVHNLGLPHGISRRERALINAMNRSTALFILLNPFTPTPGKAPSEVIPHGTMAPWFEQFDIPASVAGHLAYAGRIRRYKGVESLVTSFRGINGEESTDLRLWVGGLPSTDDLADHLRHLAGADPRITFDFGFQPDAEVARRLGEAEMVVLPYREMHNSAALLLALSLGRSVLAPANDVNQALSDEVGPGWVFQFEGTLTPEILWEAIEGQRAASAGRQLPDLSRRGWRQSGQHHVAAYRRALRLLRG